MEPSADFLDIFKFKLYLLSNFFDLSPFSLN